MLFVFNPLWLFVFQISCFVFSAPTEHVALPLESDGSTVMLPLKRRAGPYDGEYLDLPAIANHLRAKHGFPTIDYKNTEEPSESPRSLQRRINFNSVEMFDDGPDISYFATIGVGTPPKKFNVVLDTGSSDLFLSSSVCTKGCEDTVVYNPANSRTSVVEGKIVNITLGSVKVTGELASDLVLLGGFRVNPQTFAMAKTIKGEILSDRVHGLLGLGFQSLAKTGAVPFVQSLVNSKRLKQPIMSFYFQRHLTDLDNDIAPGGTLTLGDVVSTIDVNTIERHPLVTSNFWAISLETITSQGSPISIPPNLASAIIDTGSTLIGAPSSVFSTICQRLRGDVHTTGTLTGFCVLPCNLNLNSLEMAFTFTGGKAHPLNSTDLVYPQPDGKNGQVCVSPIFDLTPGSAPVPELAFSWVVGLPFLKNVYTVFDFNPPSVGFATLPSHIPPPPSQAAGVKKRPRPPPPSSGAGSSTASLKSGSGTGGTGLAGTLSNPNSGTTGTKGSSKPCSKKFLGIFSKC